MYVLTSSPYVCNLFTKQKSELNFDSNEDFILFLLTNTCKLASFGKRAKKFLTVVYVVFYSSIHNFFIHTSSVLSLTYLSFTVYIVVRHC